MDNITKDPAFLFYSNDFYQGTRMMLPEERACYIDLMIYQHQNGFIPNEIKRLLLYCSGIDEATLIAVLEAKFKRDDKGWYNERLRKVATDRKAFAQRQSINGTIGQFWKRAKATLKTKKEYDKLRKKLYGIPSEEIIALINTFTINELTPFEAMLEAMLKHLEDEDVNVNEDNNKIIGGFKTDFISDAFYPIVERWINHKISRRESYKTQDSFEAMYRQLLKLSNDNSVIASEVVEQSMANNWAGLFKLKTDDNGTNNNGRVSKTTIPASTAGYKSTI